MLSKLLLLPEVSPTKITFSLKFLCIMRCCTVPILLAAFCAQGSVAYPIPEAFAAAYPELQDAASSALATAAEKRELETDDQAIDKESEVIRYAPMVEIFLYTDGE